ncbi:hypothetical protein [Allobranchiibius sp. GilTou38]|uniref:hypothetical protein n=1 Tax=Allobranchiibius sp. GilTou38 TaxID=2815210 RepID=UPI001AA1C790|nr:hypothetical protein [Allobranchiibius sp. GilTou38]MBO1765792.1 hypothetical protein [Allobranchiibius sp. GilTou38]
MTIPLPQLLTRAREALTRYGHHLATAMRTGWAKHVHRLSRSPVYRELITALAEALVGREQQAYRTLARLIAALLIQHRPDDPDDWGYAT